MTTKKSDGRHGGNRGSGEMRDDNPNRKGANTDVDSQSANRNEDRAGGRKLGNP